MLRARAWESEHAEDGRMEVPAARQRKNLAHTMALQAAAPAATVPRTSFPSIGAKFLSARRHPKWTDKKSVDLSPCSIGLQVVLLRPRLEGQREEGSKCVSKAWAAGYSYRQNAPLLPQSV